MTLWFVGPEGDGSVYIWRTRGRSSWVANVRANPAVKVDFGSGPVGARATEVGDPRVREELLAAFLAKYALARLFRLLGWTRRARYFRLVPDEPS